MSEVVLALTVRNERDIKLDLLYNKTDGWLRLRRWKTNNDGQSASIVEIAFTARELDVMSKFIERGPAAEFMLLQDTVAGK